MGAGARGGCGAVKGGEGSRRGGPRAAGGGWGPVLVAGLPLRAPPGKSWAFLCAAPRRVGSAAPHARSRFVSVPEGVPSSPPSSRPAPNTWLVPGSPLGAAGSRHRAVVNAAASQTCFFTVAAAEALMDGEGLVCFCRPSVFKSESAIEIMAGFVC